MRPARRKNVLPNSLQSRRDARTTPRENVRQVFQSGLDTPIIFAGDECEAIRIANLAGQALKLLWGFPRRIFLVHPVEHRKVDRLGVDQFDGIAPAPQPLNQEFGEADAHPVGTIGAVKDEDSIAHRSPSAAKFTAEDAVGPGLVGGERFELPTLSV